MYRTHKLTQTKLDKKDLGEGIQEILQAPNDGKYSQTTQGLGSVETDHLFHLFGALKSHMCRGSAPDFHSASRSFYCKACSSSSLLTSACTVIWFAIIVTLASTSQMPS